MRDDEFGILGTRRPASCGDATACGATSACR